MNAIELLKQDHRKVEALFAEYEKLGDRAFKSKAKVVTQLIAELRVHAAIEEQQFYPGAREATGDDDLILEAFEEHHLVKFMLGELEAMEPDNERYDAKVTVLKELVAHHVEEEEEDLFPEVQKALGSAKLETLGERLARAKREQQGTGRKPRITVTLLEDAPAKKATSRKREA